MDKFSLWILYSLVTWKLEVYLILELTGNKPQVGDSSTDVLNKPKLVCLESSNKWENMKLDSHMQASLMVGLIDKFRGASNYLKDPAELSQVTQLLIFRIKERKDF